MRTLAVFRTFLRQKLRDRFSLALTLLTAPAFVLAYWLFFAEARTSFTVAVLASDDAVAGSAVSAALGRLTVAADGRPLLTVRTADSRTALEGWLRGGEASVGVVIPPGFAAAVRGGARPATVTLLGDASSPSYRVGAVLVQRALEGLGHHARGTTPPIVAAEAPLGLSGARTAFESYVPALLVFTVIMLIFSSSMSVVREVEAGTLARLRLTPVGPLALLAGLSAVELLLGACALALTFGTASLLGFRSAGSLPLAMAIAGLTSVATVGIGMFVASLSRTMIRAFLIASVAMFLLVLFSGLVFPRPKVPLFALGGHVVDLFDALPTTHMGAALGKVLTMGAGAGEVGYELVALASISLASFALGGLVFARSGRPAAQAWDGLP